MRRIAVAFVALSLSAVGCASKAASDTGDGGSGSSGGGSSGGSGTSSGSSGSSGGSSGGVSSGSGGSSGGRSSSGGSSGGRITGDGGPPVPSCAYTDDASFCACMGWDCGGTTVGLKNSSGDFITVYCGTCASPTWCQPNNPSYVGVGKCGGSSPLVYPYQRQLINMLEAMGENDTTDFESQYSYLQDLHDGRGYTIGTVGFCTGTGDFIVVARCLNDLEPKNSLAKYWPGLVKINDAFYAQNMNNADHTPVDAIGPFATDVPNAGMSDMVYRQCQDTIGDTSYMDTALKHAQERGLRGALTIGFLYDTELNFGDDDDPNGTKGAKSVMLAADKNYGPGLPTDFTGKPWEESRWLGFVIKERALVMATDVTMTWQSNIDRNAWWEAARRLHTGKSNNPETDTDLSMAYDIVSNYAASGGAGPCWTDLPYKMVSNLSFYDIAPIKTGTDPSKWMAVDTGNAPASYAPCPPNPTP